VSLHKVQMLCLTAACEFTGTRTDGRGIRQRETRTSMFPVLVACVWQCSDLGFICPRKYTVYMSGCQVSTGKKEPAGKVN
jgi:hypothetical protein